MSTATASRNRVASLLDGNGNGSAKTETTESVKVTRPNLRTVKIKITGNAPYLQCRFSQKAQNAMLAKQMKGDKQAGGKRPQRAARDTDADYKGALHVFKDGKGYGIPASAFRSAAISACRLVGFKMTIAKLSIFVVADGYDVVDSAALIRINGTPKKHMMIGRNADGGADIRVRAIFEDWSAIVTVRFDEDQFSLADVMNLFMRIGAQVGIGEGRPDSKNSAGMGYGTFDIET